MSAFDVIGGLAILFGLLNFAFPGSSFRSSWPTSKGSNVTEAGTELTRVLGGLLVVIGVIFVLV